jgi:hypothetical protein
MNETPIPTAALAFTRMVESRLVRLAGTTAGDPAVAGAVDQLVGAWSRAEGDAIEHARQTADGSDPREVEAALVRARASWRELLRHADEAILTVLTVRPMTTKTRQREVVEVAWRIEELALALLIGVRGQTLIAVEEATDFEPELPDLQLATTAWLGEIATEPDSARPGDDQ